MFRVPASMVLAVECKTATQHLFQDLGDPSEPKITSDKIQSFNERLAREAREKQTRIERALARLESGEITGDQYEKLVSIYTSMAFTEDGQVINDELNDAVHADPALQFFNDVRFIRSGATDGELRALEGDALDADADAAKGNANGQKGVEPAKKAAPARK
jgi:hypothetical protein